MIIHIVMFKLKDSADGRDKSENIILMRDKLESLPGKIDFIRRLEVGLNFNDNPAAFDIALYTEFDRREDLDAYQIHPDHREVAGFILKIIDQRAVADYER